MFGNENGRVFFKEGKAIQKSNAKEVSFRLYYQENNKDVIKAEVTYQDGDKKFIMKDTFFRNYKELV